MPRFSAFKRVLPMVTFAIIALGAVSHADTLHRIDAGAFEHHESGWVFPQQIGAFTLVGTPTDVNGTIDVVAAYAQTEGQRRTIATVDVYPADSAAASVTLEAASAAIERELKTDAGSRAQFEVEVGEGSSLSGVLRVYKGGENATSQTRLYYFDTGRWIVRIRAVVERDAGVQSVPALDDFVRAQRWETLALTDETCTGRACKPASVQPSVAKTRSMVLHPGTNN